MSDLKGPVLVVGAVIENSGSFLVTKRLSGDPFPGMWEFPGGKIEPGESPEEALRRECREELDVDLAVKDIRDVIFHRYEEFDVLLLFYNCEMTAGIRPRPLGCEKFTWAKASEMQSMNFLPADKPLIRKMASENDESVEIG